MAYLNEDKMKQILVAHTPKLLDMIQIEPKVVAYFVQGGAIPPDESESIRAIELPKKAKQYMFDIVKSKLENFLCFCIVLHDTLGRDDIVCDTFKLNIFDLRQQKKEIDDEREKRRLALLERERQAKQKDEASAKGVMERKEEEKQDEHQSPKTNGHCSTDAAGTAAPKLLAYEDVVKLIIDSRNTFYKRFDVTNRVLAELKRVKVITPDTEDKLKMDHTTPNDKINEILDTVQKRGVKPFLDFCLVLCDDDILQDHLVTEVLKLNIDDIGNQRAGLP